MSKLNDYGRLEVTFRPNDDADKLIKKFMRKFKDSGLVEELRRRSSYEKPSARRRRKDREAKSRR